MAQIARYYLSIEPVEGKSYLLPTSTGSDLAVARIAVEQVFNALGCVGKTPRSIAVVSGEGVARLIADCHSGLSWDSDARFDE